MFRRKNKNGEERIESVEERSRRVLGPPPQEVKVARDRISREEMLQLRRLGYSMAQIGEYYGVSRATAYRVWKGR